MILIPFLVAYLFKGVKDPVSLCLVYILVSSLLIKNHKENAKQHLPKELLVFAIFLVWVLIRILLNPPLDIYLMSFSKLVLYASVALIFLSFGGTKTNATYGAAVLFFSVVETAVVFWINPGSKYDGGFLTGNPLYSSLLISSGFLFSINLLNNPKEFPSVPVFLTIPLIVLLGTGLLLPQSRGTILGTIFASFIFLRFKRSRIFLLTIYSALAVFLLIDKGFRYSFIELNPQNLALDFQELYLGRLVIWKSWLIAFLHNPLIGYGLGNFESAYLLWQQPSHHVLRYSMSTMFAHNDYLQIALEAGLPAFILIGLCVTIYVLRIRRSKLGADVRTWCHSVIIMYLVSSMLNFNFYLPFNGMIFGACMGIALSDDSKPLRDIWNRDYLRKPFLALVLCLLLFIVPYGISEIYLKAGHLSKARKIMPFRSDLWYASAMEEIMQSKDMLKDKNAQEKAIHLLNNALILNPENPFTWARLGEVLSLTQIKTDLLLPVYIRALKRAPFHAPFWIQTGQMLLTRDRTDEAFDYFRMASTLEPNAPLPYYFLGLTYKRKRDMNSAHVEFEQALSQYFMFNDKKDSSAYAAFLFSVNPQEIRKLISKPD